MDNKHSDDKKMDAAAMPHGDESHKGHDHEDTCEKCHHDKHEGMKCSKCDCKMTDSK